MNSQAALPRTAVKPARDVPLALYQQVKEHVLRKIGDATVQPDNDQTRGKIAQIGYLLQVTEEK